MKVLRIYDHNGQLQKEFNVYVDGESFWWMAPVPEPLWLGTIILEDAGKEPESPPEPILEEEKPQLIVSVKEGDVEVVEVVEDAGAELEKIIEEKVTEPTEEPEKVPTPAEVFPKAFRHHPEPEVSELQPEPETEGKEEKGESKKRSKKSKRDKRTGASGSPEKP